MWYISKEDYIAHYGVGHLNGGDSGRYPWGSGERPYQGAGGQNSNKEKKDQQKKNFENLQNVKYEDWKNYFDKDDNVKPIKQAYNKYNNEVNKNFKRYKEKTGDDNINHYKEDTMNSKDKNILKEHKLEDEYYKKIDEYIDDLLGEYKNKKMTGKSGLGNRYNTNAARLLLDRLESYVDGYDFVTGQPTSPREKKKEQKSNFKELKKIAKSSDDPFKLKDFIQKDSGFKKIIDAHNKYDKELEKNYQNYKKKYNDSSWDNYEDYLLENTKFKNKLNKLWDDIEEREKEYIDDLLGKYANKYISYKYKPNIKRKSTIDKRRADRVVLRAVYLQDTEDNRRK